MNKEDQQQARLRQGRRAAVVIAVSGLAAIFAPVLTELGGLPMRFEMLVYLLALAGFAWALIVALQIWRQGRNK